MKTTVNLFLLMFALLFLNGCVTDQPYDYTAFNEAKPRSILVIPPMNDSVEVKAPYTFMSTVTKPLSERGYYVFPVAVVDAFLKENGMPSPDEMNSAPLNKLHENTGADAVLYVTINNWGQSYQVVASVATVDAHIKLVDAKTGTMLWDSKVFMSQGSGDGGGGIAGMLVAAVVDQVMSSYYDKTVALSTAAITKSANNKVNGLPAGPYKPEPAKP